MKFTWCRQLAAGLRAASVRPGRCNDLYGKLDQFVLAATDGLDRPRPSDGRTDGPTDRSNALHAAAGKKTRAAELSQLNLNCSPGPTRPDPDQVARVPTNTYTRPAAQSPPARPVRSGAQQLPQHAWHGGAHACIVDRQFGHRVASR